MSKNVPIEAERKRKNNRDMMTSPFNIIADTCRKRLLEYDDPKSIRDILRSNLQMAEYAIRELIPRL